MREEFKSLFGLPTESFLEPIDLTDHQIGFSVYKTQPQPGFKSLFRVFIQNKELENDNALKPVIVTADYGKEYEGGITISSTEWESASNWPVGLISKDDFFYNIKTKELFYKNKKITGIGLLKKINELHIKPTKFIRGFFFRLKAAFLRRWMSYIPITFIWMLYLISGEKISSNLWERKFSDERVGSEIQRNSKIEKEPQKLNIFGYLASRWAITFYCLVHLILFLLFVTLGAKIFWLTKFTSLISRIFKNNLLVVMYVIPSLGFVDYALPKLLKFVIKKTTNLAIWAATINIKV